MIRNDEHWLSLTDAFYAAATGGANWQTALEGLATATGSQSSELIAIDANADVQLNIVNNVDPGLSAAFAAAGGAHPSSNPRVAAAIKAPILKTVAESDFIKPDEIKRHPHYQEFAVPWDIPFICLATLERHNGLRIGMTVMRSRRDGHITSAQREIFENLAPHVRAAVRMQIALEGQGAALVAGAMEALSIAAFVCDRTGCVKALTPTAEELVGSRRGLQVKLGQLRAREPADDKALRVAIAAAASGTAVLGSAAMQTVMIGGGIPGAPLVLDVIPLPRRQYEFSFEPRLLVVARGSRRSAAERADLLRAAYALTAAEADVALQLAEGKTAEAIAAGRGVALGTVRAQIKAVMAKLGVHRQIELVARLDHLR